MTVTSPNATVFPSLVLLKRSTAFPSIPTRSVVSHRSFDDFAIQGLGGAT